MIVTLLQFEAVIILFKISPDRTKEKLLIDGRQVEILIYSGNISTCVLKIFVDRQEAN